MIYHSGAMSIESPFPFENVHGVRNLYIQDNSKRFGFTNVYPAGWQQGGVLRPANSTYNYGSQTTHKAGLYYPSGEQMEIPNYKPYEEK